MNKVVCNGHFDFGSDTTYAKAVALFTTRGENYYKNDFLIKLEDFYDGNNSLAITKLVNENVADKTTRNTTTLLKELAGFALCGMFTVSVIDENKKCVVKEYSPTNADKSAIKDFNDAMNLRHEGKLVECVVLLSRVIERFPLHSSAWALRGKVHMQMNDVESAMQDFEQAIKIQPKAAKAYLGRVRAINKLIQNRDKKTNERVIADLNSALSLTLPVQSTFWKAKKMKGIECFNQGLYKEAELEFAYFLRQTFEPKNPNFIRRAEVLCYMGMTFHKLNKKAESLKMFEECLSSNPNPKIAELARTQLDMLDFKA